MEYVKFGNTGMDVSKICLGTMGFGDKDKWIHKWVLDEANSRPIIKKRLIWALTSLILQIFILTAKVKKLLAEHSKIMLTEMILS